MIPASCRCGRTWERLRQSSGWTKSPLSSLGSNHVLLGGMMWPRSATAMSGSTVVGQSEVASAAPPASPWASRARGPRMPPPTPSPRSASGAVERGGGGGRRGGAGGGGGGVGAGGQVGRLDRGERGHVRRRVGDRPDGVGDPVGGGEGIERRAGQRLRHEPVDLWPPAI